MHRLSAIRQYEISHIQEQLRNSRKEFQKIVDDPTASDAEKLAQTEGLFKATIDIIQSIINIYEGGKYE